MSVHILYFRKAISHLCIQVDELEYPIHRTELSRFAGRVDEHIVADCSPSVRESELSNSFALQQV